MTLHNAPTTFASTQADLGRAYEFAQQEMLLELQDQLDVMGEGVVQLLGDFSGTGTDVMHVTHMGNVGFSVGMTPLTVETEAIPRSRISTGFTTVTLGMFGLAHSNTYKHTLLSREPKVLLEGIKARAPQSYAKQFRTTYCTVGATFTDFVGSVTTQASVDDYLDLLAKFRERLGSGAPTATFRPKQITQLLESFRSEPAFQSAVEGFTGLQALTQVQRISNFAKLGMDVLLTDDVVESGGGYVGFAHDPGAVGYGVANTSRLANRVANRQDYFLIPQLGLLVEGQTNGSGQAVEAYEARAFFGMDKRSTDVSTQVRFLSVAA